MKQFTSILLSLLLLSSSISLAYTQHFCGGNIVAEALVIGEKNLSCDGLTGMSYNHNDEKPPCCDDVIYQIETDAEFQTSVLKVDLNPIFVTAFVEIFVLGAQELTSHKEIAYSNYYPPPLIQDIPVLFETFLL